MGFSHKVRTSDGNEAAYTGIVCAWSNSRGYIPREEFKREWLACGLEEAILGELSREEIFQRAANICKRENGGNVGEIRDGQEKVIAFFTTVSDDNEDLKLIQGAKIKWDKANERIVCDNPDAERKFREVMEFVRTHFSQGDLTRYLKRVFQGCGIIKLRSAGGMYFVPAHYATIVRNAKAFFEKIDPRGMFTYAELAKTVDTQKTIEVSYKDELGEKLKLIEKEWKSLEEEGKKLSSCKFKNRLEELSKLVSEMEIYKDITESNLKESEDYIKKTMIALQEFAQTGKAVDLETITI